MESTAASPDLRSSSTTLTFLFTDLAGSTQLWERFPDAMKDALRRHDMLVRGAIEGSGGHVVKTTGDGMMAVFESASDAVSACLVAQRALAEEPWAATGDLRVRMALHAGVADRRGDDFFGPSVNRTARIMAVGHGGQVLLSASAAALAVDALPDGASLRDLGEHKLKDLDRPERTFQLVHPDLAPTFPPLVTSGREPTNLPAAATAFVGREVELEEIARQLGEPAVRMLTLTGPGGTGKTTLAVRAATSQLGKFGDGVYFVDLSTARDTDSVLLAIARVLGIGEVIDRPLVEELVDRLRHAWMLLVLDNFEQVTEAAGVATRLLADCPQVRLLITSREALHVRAERLFAVPPLGLPSDARAQSAAEIGRCESVQLFVERAQAVRPDFELTDENAADVAEICRRLDGLPLAIELAAARMRLFSPEALRERLGSRLELLRSGARDLPERQQTLRGTIEWSYQLLDPPEQRLFELLAVFAEADVAAVEAVATQLVAGASLDGAGVGDIDALGGIASLLEKSLVRQVTAADGEPRVAMLETIREYATERLDEHPDVGRRARVAHATYFADLASRERTGLIGSRREAALAIMSSEIGNLRIAWREWAAAGDVDHLNKMADSMLILSEARGWYLDTVVLTTDLLDVLATTTSTPDRVSQEIALRTSLARALMTTKGYTPEVEAAYEQTLELFERGGEIRQHYSVLRGLASLYLMRAEFEKGQGLGREILELAEREGDPSMAIDGHLVVGSTLVFGGHLKEGSAHLDEAISSFGAAASRPMSFRLGNDPRVACLTTSAFTRWLLGYPDRAVERADAAIAMGAELDHPFSSAFAQFHSGLLHLWRREPEIVRARATRLLDIAGEHDFQIWIAVGRCLLGAAEARLGRHAEGLTLIRRGMDLYQGITSPPVFWPMLHYLDAGTSLAAGRPSEALPRIEAAIELLSARVGSAILPEFYLLRGDVLGPRAEGSPGDAVAARASYVQAFEFARDLEARMVQLRAATRLARLSAGTPAAESDRRVLGELFATFDEGFETLDLQEAAALLG